MNRSSREARGRQSLNPYLAATERERTSWISILRQLRPLVSLVHLLLAIKGSGFRRSDLYPQMHRALELQILLSKRSLVRRAVPRNLTMKGLKKIKDGSMMIMELLRLK